MSTVAPIALVWALAALMPAIPAHSGDSATVIAAAPAPCSSCDARHAALRARTGTRPEVQE